MRVRQVIIKVENQDSALAFYTAVLGFVKKTDVPIGGSPDFRWISLVSPEEPEGVEIILETNAPPPAKASQQSLYDAGFPALIITTEDIHAEYHRLKNLGVAFRGEPKITGPRLSVFFDDTCGNIVVLAQPIHP